MELFDAPPAPTSHGPWVPTRVEGLRRLAAFVPRAGRAYAETRNADRGPGDRANVSTLSPWLRHRRVTEPEVAAAVLARWAPSTAEKFLQEVCWRTYWKGWLQLRPSVWESYRAQVTADRARADREPDLAARLAAAEAGRTGLEAFDAWAAELQATNYLHNHTRMWVASIWVFTLRLPWALGADWFLRHLLDGDPASNTLSWRWVAGLQTRGKHYLARAENIARYTEGRFDLRGRLDERAAPLEGPPHPAPRSLPPPIPPDPSLATGLLLTEEDLGVESLDLPAWVGPRAALVASARRSDLPVAPAIAAFSRGAAADALASTAGPVYDTAEAVVAWAEGHGVRQLLVPETPVGPAAELLASLARRAPDLRQATLRRDWDAEAWPHARAGFFAFRERIPDLLRHARAA